MRCRNVQNVVCVNAVRSKQQLLGENERLKQEVEALKQNAIKGEDIMKEKFEEMDLIQSDLLKQIEENEENLNRMKQQIQSLSIEKDESMERERLLNDQLTAMQNEFDKLKLSIRSKQTKEAMFETQREQKDKENKDKLSHLNGENKRLFEENKAFKLQNDNLNAMIERYKNEILALNEGITALTEKYESAQQQNNEHQKQMIALQKTTSQTDVDIENNVLLKADALMIELNEEKRKNEYLQEKQKKIESKSDKLTKEKYQIEDEHRILKTEYTDLQIEYNKLQKEIKSEMNKYDKNMHQIQKKLASQTEETNKLKQNLKQFEKDQAEQQKQYELKIEELEIMNEEQSNAIKRLNAKYAKKELTPSLSAEAAEHGAIAIDDEEQKSLTPLSDDDHKSDDAISIPHHSRTRSYGISSALSADRYHKHNEMPSEDEEMLKPHSYTSPYTRTLTHRRTKTKKYKKRNLLKTFSVNSSNFEVRKLKDGNDDEQPLRHQHLLSSRNRALSKSEKIVRRQTVALGAHFEVHLQAQKDQDAKMEKVFDALEQRKKARQRKKTLDDKGYYNDDEDEGDELFDIGPGFAMDKSQSLRNVLPPAQMIMPSNDRASSVYVNSTGIFPKYVHPSLPKQNILDKIQSNLMKYGHLNDYQRKSQTEKDKIKSAERAKLALVYDNEYKAMKRRYQQKKRKRVASRLKSGTKYINYTE